jgi:uncharacterized protein (TIGR02145 family)
MKTLKAVLISLAILAAYTLSAQVAINIDGSLAAESAMLDVQSTNKGFLPPRMSEEQRNAIAAPEAGLVVWCNNCGEKGELQVFNGTAWTNLVGGTATHAPYNCGVALLDTRDNRTYATVKIGTQCWMAQNLNIGNRIDSLTAMTNNGIMEKYCYRDNESNCDVYGGLYQWAELVQYLNGADDTVSWNPVPSGNVRGLCPEGWHLPDTAEWSTLLSYVADNGFLGTEGTALKSTTGWTEGGNGTDNFGFTCLPGGVLAFGPSFYGVNDLGIFWESTQQSASDAYLIYMVSVVPQVISEYTIKTIGASVRCIAD